MQVLSRLLKVQRNKSQCTIVFFIVSFLCLLFVISKLIYHIPVWLSIDFCDSILANRDGSFGFFPYFPQKRQTFLCKKSVFFVFFRSSPLLSHLIYWSLFCRRSDNTVSIAPLDCTAFQLISCFLQNCLLTQYIPPQMAMASTRYPGLRRLLSSDCPNTAIMPTMAPLPSSTVRR